MPDVERLVSRAMPAAPEYPRIASAERKVANPLQSIALPCRQMPLVRGLAALVPFGADGRRRERFLQAREQGCCYQCHAPFQNLLNDCPCPHWIVTSACTVERIAPVLGMYPLADVLHFILLHLAAEGAGRAPGRNAVTGTCDAAGARLTVRLGRKSWSFGVAGDGDAARLTVGLFNPRTGRHSAIDLPATGRDRAALHAVAAALGAR